MWSWKSIMRYNVQPNFPRLCRLLDHRDPGSWLVFTHGCNYWAAIWIATTNTSSRLIFAIPAVICECGSGWVARSFSCAQSWFQRLQPSFHVYYSYSRPYMFSHLSSRWLRFVVWLCLWYWINPKTHLGAFQYFQTSFEPIMFWQLVSQFWTWRRVGEFLLDSKTVIPN